MIDQHQTYTKFKLTAITQFNTLCVLRHQGVFWTLSVLFVLFARTSLCVASVYVRLSV